MPMERIIYFKAMTHIVTNAGEDSTVMRKETNNRRNSSVQFEEQLDNSRTVSAVVNKDGDKENGRKRDAPKSRHSLGYEESIIENQKRLNTIVSNFPPSQKSSTRRSSSNESRRMTPSERLQMSLRRSTAVSGSRMTKSDSIDTGTNNIIGDLRSSTTSYDNSESRCKDSRRRGSIKSFLSCGTDTHTIDEQVLKQKDSRSIWFLRILTFTTLVTAASIVASLTFTLTRNYEFNEFETEYISSVAKVEEAIITSIENKLNTAKTLASVYMSQFGPDHVWPNVTMPDFQQIAVGQLEITESIALSYNPIINGTEERQEFEAYASQVASKLGAEQLVERSCPSCRIVADGVFRKIDGIAINDPGISPESRYPEIMVPVWQIFPTKVNWKAVMFNLHSEINRQHALDDMLEYHVPTVTALLHLVQHDEMNPSSIMFFPVLDHFIHDVESEENPSPPSSSFFSIHDEEGRIKGSISIVFLWEDILRQVLPSYIEGMVVVLESSVSSELPHQLWTYEVNGEQVSLLGEGDHHNEKFDRFEHIVKANVARGIEELGNVDYLITYELRMYPSDRFQARYTSKRPGVMCGVIVAIFLFTSFVFLCYDYLVKTRQIAVMAFASRSGKIVNSLFPESVRSRMMDNVHHFAGIHRNGNESHDDPLPRRSSTRTRGCRNHDDRKRVNSGTSTTSRSGLKDDFQKRHIFVVENIKKYLHKGRRSSNEDIEGSTETKPFSCADENGIVNLITPPIADLFPETSIMFADIVGFTEWSSCHSPEEVFHLLESLFYEFDRLASAMNVFKLGTIGDCYIAVTGIPDAHNDHAVTLCQFAERCRLEMSKFVSKLYEPLGQVNRLSMRFGIHSGPVTAGVLRGQKSRFELFGDTMNTASRMESNGLPNKIQISQETADLLIAAGHRDWITPRTSLVQAKGKGMLQTYWFDTSGSKSIGESPLQVAGGDDTPMSHHPFYQAHEDIAMDDVSIGNYSSDGSIALGNLDIPV